MTPRIAANIRIQALVRIAQGNGGNAAILHRGDRDSGDIAIVLLARGTDPVLLRRMPATDFSTEWRASAVNAGEAPDAPDVLSRLTRRDPDLWIIEVDVPERERFIAQLGAMG